MKNSALFLLFILLAASVALVVFKRQKSSHAAAGAAQSKNAPVPVRLAKVQRMALPEEIRSFGTVEPMLTVAVKSQTTGILTNVLFSEGQDVREGDLLFAIDPRPAEAALRQAEATLARDRAQLANAKTEAARQEILLAKGISAQDVRDAAVTAAETLQATVQADEAAVDAARLQVGYCSIRAPIAGRTGNLLVHRGNLVKANDTALVTINQIHPILVRFTLPQQALDRIRNGGQLNTIQVKATPPGTGSRTETGLVTFMDNAVDEATGTIQLKARFDNPASTLWPGQFVGIILQLIQSEPVLTVPETAVLPGQKGAYVYVKDDQNKVSARPVTTGRTIAGMTVILSGLKAGEAVVTDGQIRLKPGSLVTSDDSPKSKTAGQP